MDWRVLIKASVLIVFFVIVLLLVGLLLDDWPTGKFSFLKDMVGR